MKYLIKITLIALISFSTQYSKAQDIEKYLKIAENAGNSYIKLVESNQYSNSSITDFENSITNLDFELERYKSDIDNLDPLKLFTGRDKMLKLYSSTVKKRNEIVINVKKYNEIQNEQILKDNAILELKKKKVDSLATIEKQNKIKLDSINKLEEKNKLEASLRKEHINDSIQNLINKSNQIKLEKYLTSQEWKSTKLKVKNLEAENYNIAVQIEKSVRSTVKGYTIFGNAIQEVPKGLYANLKAKSNIIKKNLDTIHNISETIYSNYGKELYEIDASTSAEIEKAMYAIGIAGKI
ncbi:hypothetical protein AAGV28_14620 [Flavobacterium sp. FZUC8N2.13]|uniref:Uncharacterized protein n=1 Tax=Flavobacterium zubiriense TaxID=3138075 RepID=A0ABV4TF28_9FLAO